VTSAAAIGSVNPVAIASAWILVHPDVAAAFAKYPARDESTGVRISGVVEPPYPMLRVVTTPGGALNDARWRISPEILLEAWGDTDAYPGPAALQEIVTTACVCLRGLEDKDYQPWEPVVTHVDVAAPYPLDDPTGQARWLATATLTCHPALAPGSGPPPAEHVQGG
jgi:hypothetical protein